MLKVIFLILGFFLCFVFGWYAACVIIYVGDYVGTLRTIYINDRFERMMVAFNDKESKDKLKKRKYVLLNVERIYNEDPDDITLD